MADSKLTDRTRILEYQRCPRARWYYSEIYGRGIQGLGQSVPLATGEHVHVGLAALLRGDSAANATATARAGYLASVTERGLTLNPTEDERYVIEEQAAIVEALLLAYAAVRLPIILRDFTVVEIEREHLYDLAVGIQMMSRPDAVLQRKEMKVAATCDYDEGLYIVSFKALATSSARQAKEYKHDMQGLSELVAVECAHGGRVQGVMMEILLKGPRKEYPDGSGKYVQWSPLVRGYRRLGDGGWEYRSRYKWKDAAGKGRTLPRGFERFDAWVPSGHKISGSSEYDGACLSCGDYHVPTSAWVRWLLKNDRELVESQIVTPEPIFRRQTQVDSWLLQTINQEIDVASHAGIAEGYRRDGDSGLAQWLDMYFPQHTRSCHWPSDCQFVPICHEGMSATYPLASGQFELRTPHHREELIQLTARSMANQADKMTVDIVKAYGLKQPEGPLNAFNPTTELTPCEDRIINSALDIGISERTQMSVIETLYTASETCSADASNLLKFPGGKDDTREPADNSSDNLDIDGQSVQSERGADRPAHDDDFCGFNFD